MSCQLPPDSLHEMDCAEFSFENPIEDRITIDES
jgi:hypothetical protein